MKDTRTVTSKELYIGIDIHKRSWKVHISTDLFSGKTYTMPPSAAKLKDFVDKHYSPAAVYCAYEAGCCGYMPHRQFLSYGWQSIVVNPADISRTGKDQYRKTDRLDAQKISRELKDGRLEGIEVPDRKREALRSLFRRRNELVKELRRAKSKIKMQLLYYGIEIPEAYDNNHWSHAFRGWLRDLSFEYENAKRTMESRVRHYEFIESEVREVSNQLRAYCREHYGKDYYLLKSVPGIGGIVASGILSELGDLRRFNNIKQLAGYVGLVPGVHQSGENHKTTGLIPRAHRLMRSYFIEASWQAIRADPVMENYYRKHYGKNTKKIIVKVARKLLSRVRAVIKTEKKYEIGVIE